MISEISEDSTIDMNNKLQIIQKIRDINVNTICVPDKKGATPFTPLGDLINSLDSTPDLNLFIIIGEDRLDIFDKITNIYFLKTPNINSVDALILHREGMTQFERLSEADLRTLDIESVPINAFSASFVRKLVKYNLKEKFDDVYRQYLDQSKIDTLYTLVERGLSLPSNKKPDKPPSPLKYTYPLIKHKDTIESSFKGGNSSKWGKTNKKKYRNNKLCKNRKTYKNRKKL
jgi:hypothetical protein